MSGRATGWVGEHGPRPGDVGADGVAYDLRRARPLRSVLHAVADAANADGKHAHPGVARVAWFTLYSEGQVRRLLGQLVDDGWLVIDDNAPKASSRGRGGRGVATTYDLVMEGNRHVAARVRDARVSPDADERDARVSDEKPAQESDNTRASEPKPAHLDARPTVCTTVETTNPPSAPADAVARAVWESRNPRPATPFIALRKIVERLLDAGWAEAEVTAAGKVVPTLSTGAFEFELAKRRPRQPATHGHVVDRAAPSGRLVL